MESAAVIPVGAADLSPGERSSQECTILYCGNLGRMHDVDTMCAYWKTTFPNASVSFSFHCSGPKKAVLVNTVSRLSPEWKQRISIQGSLPSEEWKQVMQESTVALVTMIPGAEKVVMPSKTYSAMMAGQAVLAICPLESDLADLVQTSGCGWVVEPGDVTGLERVLKDLESDPEEVARKQAASRAAALQAYSPVSLAGRWIEVVRELT